MTAMTPEIARKLVISFSMLKFFPADESTRVEIAKLVIDLCGSAEEAIWLRERVSAEWNEWNGPRELRALFCRRFRPADGITAETEKPECGTVASDAPAVSNYHFKYQDILGPGNAVLGVRRLQIAGPTPRALPPAKAEIAEGQACKALVVRGLAQVSRVPTPAQSREIIGAPDLDCAICQGTGLKVILSFDGNGHPADGLRCTCVFRLLPEHSAKIQQLQRVLEEKAGLDRKDLAVREAELKSEMTPLRTKQEHAAELAELEAVLGFRDPARGGGRHREVVVGAERFLVQ